MDEGRYRFRSDFTYTHLQWQVSYAYRAACDQIRVPTTFQDGRIVLRASTATYNNPSSQRPDMAADEYTIVDAVLLTLTDVRFRHKSAFFQRRL